MEFVGVKSFQELLTASLEGDKILKREALLFDKIGIPAITGSVKDRTFKDSFRDNWRDLKWLLNRGIVFDPIEMLRSKQLVITEEAEIYHQAYHEHFDILRKMERRPRRTSKQKDKFIALSTRTFRIDSLLMSTHLRHTCGLDAYPVFYQSSLFPELNVAAQDVVQIVLNALPIPDEQTSWEHIEEYRSDPDSNSKFLDLRNWMHEVTRVKLTPIEIEQKLEHLIDQYQRHMELHKMKTQAGIIETVVVSSAEFLEDLIKIRWGKIAKSLFSFRQKKIALIEGALKSPGHEVAYIIKARKTF
jgi:hypothetical protein